MKISRIAFATLIASSMLASIDALASTTVDNSSVSIVSSTAAYSSDWSASNALDGSYYTDFASAGAGVGTYLVFDFGSALTFQSIQYTDRTSSGNGNGSGNMGTSDYVTSYKYVFSNDQSFSSVVATYTANVGVPSGSLTLANFQHTDNFTDVSARYVRWEVLGTASNSANNVGAANFQFNVASVPEPEQYAMLLAGLAIVGVIAKRKGQ